MLSDDICEESHQFESKPSSDVDLNVFFAWIFYDNSHKWILYPRMCIHIWYALKNVVSFCMLCGKFDMQICGQQWGNNLKKIKTVKRNKRATFE